MDVKFFRLKGVRSPWNGEYYIGFVLDIVKEYLGLDVEHYTLSFGSPLFDARVGIIERKGRDNIIVWRVLKKVGEEEFLRENNYWIRNFPEDKINDFQRDVQGIWDRMFGEMERDKRDRFEKQAKK